MKWVKVGPGDKLPEYEDILVQFSNGGVIHGQVRGERLCYYNPDEDQYIDYTSVRDVFSACVTHYCLIERATA